jgi:hypothetical protein
MYVINAIPGRAVATPYKQVDKLLVDLFNCPPLMKRWGQEDA